MTNVQNNQRGYLGKVERVSIMGETPTSPAVVMAHQAAIHSASKTNPITSVVNSVENKTSTEITKLKNSASKTISDTFHDKLQSELNKAKQDFQYRLRKTF